MIDAAQRFWRLETGDDRRMLLGLVLAAGVVGWHVVTQFV